MIEYLKHIYMCSACAVVFDRKHDCLLHQRKDYSALKPIREASMTVFMCSHCQSSGSYTSADECFQHEREEHAAGDEQSANSPPIDPEQSSLVNDNGTVADDVKPIAAGDDDADELGSSDTSATTVDDQPSDNGRLPGENALAPKVKSTAIRRSTRTTLVGHLVADLPNVKLPDEPAIPLSRGTTKGTKKTVDIEQSIANNDAIGDLLCAPTPIVGDEHVREPHRNGRLPAALKGKSKTVRRSTRTAAVDQHVADIATAELQPDEADTSLEGTITAKTMNGEKNTVDNKRSMGTARSSKFYVEDMPLLSKMNNVVNETSIDMSEIDPMQISQNAPKPSQKRLLFIRYCIYFKGDKLADETNATTSTASQRSQMRPVACPHCPPNSPMFKRNNVNRHIIRRHPGCNVVPRECKPSTLNVTINCPYCINMYGGVDGLNRHIVRLHPHRQPITDKLFKCTQCDYAASNKFILKRHMRVHEKQTVNAKRYGVLCPHCSDSYKRVTTTNQHIARWHPGQPPISGTFKCVHCQYSTKWQHSVNRHLRTKHKGRTMTKSTPVDKLQMPNVADTIMKSTFGEPSTSDTGDQQPVHKSRRS